MALKDRVFALEVTGSRLAECSRSVQEFVDSIYADLERHHAAAQAAIDELNAVNVRMATYLTHSGPFRGQHVEEVLAYFRGQATGDDTTTEGVSNGAEAGHSAQEDRLAE